MGDQYEELLRRLGLIADLQQALDLIRESRDVEKLLEGGVIYPDLEPHLGASKHPALIYPAQALEFGLLPPSYAALLQERHPTQKDTSTASDDVEGSDADPSAYGYSDSYALRPSAPDVPAEAEEPRTAELTAPEATDEVESAEPEVEPAADAEAVAPDDAVMERDAAQTEAEIAAEEAEDADSGFEDSDSESSWASGSLRWWMGFRELPPEEQREVHCDEQIQSLYLELQQRLSFLKSERFTKEECQAYAESLPRTQEIDNLWCDAHLKTLLDEVSNALYESLMVKSSKLSANNITQSQDAIEQYVAAQISGLNRPEREMVPRTAPTATAFAAPAAAELHAVPEAQDRTIQSPNESTLSPMNASSDSASCAETSSSSATAPLAATESAVKAAGQSAARSDAGAAQAAAAAGDAAHMVMNEEVSSSDFGPQRVTLLGATGSIGDSTCEVLRQHPERYIVHALVANSNVEKMLGLIAEFKPARVAMFNEHAASALKQRLEDDPALRALRVDICSGSSGVIEVAGDGVAEIVVAAIVGSSGLAPVLAALKTGCRMCLANKEALVMSGQLFFDVARQFGSTVLPVDSEHSAIFQCLPPKEQRRLGFCELEAVGVREILLTGSGGPFRDSDLSVLRTVTPAMAINHPVWSMGPKISVDSATMMNKALEFIEARYLFNARADQIKVIIHPQSVIHSMVAYQDGAVLAQMGSPDMKTPIAHALAYPERISAPVESLDFTKISALTFKAPDKERYPCLFMGIEASQKGQAITTALNAANEVAVAEFLHENLSFLGIADVVKYVLDKLSAHEAYTLEEIMAVDTLARSLAHSYIESRH